MKQEELENYIYTYGKGLQGWYSLMSMEMRFTLMNWKTEKG